ncbi:MAG: hypothetical protein QOF46_1401, partial [Paraburkholderia sp.]|nr:hypothetical protein [Paraburkholderia sp.]
EVVGSIRGWFHGESSMTDCAWYCGADTRSRIAAPFIYVMKLDY